ncbi:hypothetical protein HHI36_020841 [Cryptolaemus montrouzieri]|uniref:Uncharacterized protein n=1 Tax=Cryptolaemus montrouzieri TaxID=559131 RepID=A0ABD2NBQ2_9CUCU
MNFSIELEEIKKNYIRTQELISSFSESSDREFADHIFRNSSTPTPWKHNQLEEEVKDVSSNKINTLIKKGNENLSEIDSESEEIQKNDELSWKNTKISVETTPRQDSTSSAETEAVPPKIVPKEIEKSENCSDKKDLELNLNYVQEQVPEEAEMGENLDIRTCQNIKQINDKEKRDICSSQMQCPGDNEDRVQIQTEQKEENKPEKKVLRKRRIRTYKEENVRRNESNLQIKQIQRV